MYLVIISRKAWKKTAAITTTTSTATKIYYEYMNNNKTKQTKKVNSIAMKKSIKSKKKTLFYTFYHDPRTCVSLIMKPTSNLY